MPRLSAWFVRASLIYLLLGFALGALLLVQDGVSFYPAIYVWLPVHMEFLLVGWLAQLAMGVAFWILPRFGLGAPRGHQWLIWTAFALLNLGVLLIALQVWLPAALPVGRFSEAAAAAAFIAGSWGRVKPAGK